MQLLVLSDAVGGAKVLLPALEFLDHTIAVAALSPEGLSLLGDADVLLIDATRDLAGASAACRAAASAELERPILVVVSEGSLAAVKVTWGFDDWLLPSAQPAEVETRLRLVADRSRARSRQGSASIGDLDIDPDTYVVRLRDRVLDLTFREFELLRHLATNPGRVFTRGQLLSEVWGYDYYGGTRTVDVHIRRLREKLPRLTEALVTVKQFGYRLEPV